MKLSLTTNELANYITSQLNHFFPDKDKVTVSDIVSSLDTAIDRLEYCFKNVAYQRYNKNGETILNHLYADQYLMFIWFLSNTVFREKGPNHLANKLYYLNKSLHAIDCMFDTNMPDIFLIFHGAGTMLGKAAYSDYFVALQGCTVGAQKGKYPVMGKGVALTAHSAIIGDCNIGNRVSVSAYTAVLNKNVEADNIVYRDDNTGKMVAKQVKISYSQQFFLTDLSSL